MGGAQPVRRRDLRESVSLMGASRTLAVSLLVQVDRRAGVMVCYAADVAGRAAVLKCGGGRECRHRKGSGGVIRTGVAADRDSDGQRKRARCLRLMLLPMQCCWLLPRKKESEATRPGVREERKPRGRSGGVCRRSCVESLGSWWLPAEKRKAAWGQAWSHGCEAIVIRS